MIDKISSKAFKLGFTAIGFSRPVKPLFFDEFKKWVGSGKNADMSWMERNMDIRENPVKLLPGCRTVISLAYPYPAEKPATDDGFTLARYSTPDEDDYHLRLRQKGKELSSYIGGMIDGIKSRVLVDSAPLLERSFAYSSGMGFIGKNNMLIIPGSGSYFYLCEILTTAELNVIKSDPCEDLCVACTKCIDSCPTGALKGARDFDASICLSYLTIEDKTSVSEAAGKRMGNCFLGCDICQEVCPHNPVRPVRKCVASTDKIMKMKDGDFNRIYIKTSLSRPGLEKIKSNIRSVRGRY